MLAKRLQSESSGANNSECKCGSTKRHTESTYEPGRILKMKNSAPNSNKQSPLWVLCKCFPSCTHTHTQMHRSWLEFSLSTIFHSYMRMANALPRYSPSYIPYIPPLYPKSHFIISSLFTIANSSDRILDDHYLNDIYLPMPLHEAT